MRVFDNHKAILVIIFIAAIGLLSATTLLKNRGKTTFHGDESGWISSGYYYTNLLLKGDFARRKWHKKELRAWGYMCPHVGKWIIGIPLLLHHPDHEFLRLYNFSKSFEENEKEGNIPPQEVLLRSRAVSAILGGLCCLIIFMIGYMCYNLWVGTIAAVILLGNKLFFLSATRAMTDIPYNLFLLGLSLCGLLIIQKTSIKRMAFGSLLFGTLSGLACSVKITGIVIGGLFLTAILLLKYIVYKNKKEVILVFTLYCFSSLAIVYTLNPLFWPDLSQFRGSLFIHEMASFTEELPTIIAARELPDRNRIEMYLEKYPQLTNLSRVFIFPYLFVKWNSFMNSMKNSPSASWHGNRLKSFHLSLLIKYATFSGEVIFFFFGIIACFHATYKALQKHRLPLWSIPLLYFFSNYVFILIFMKLNWDRYYLPTIMASKIIVAVGVYELCSSIHRFLSKHLRQAR